MFDCVFNNNIENITFGAHVYISVQRVHGLIRDYFKDPLSKIKKK